MTSLQEKFQPKGSVLSVKGILGICAIVLAVIGGITIWSADIAGDTIYYYTALLVILAILNFVGFIFGFPLLFAFSAACFWAAAPPLMDAAQQTRLAIRRGVRNSDTRATLAGFIILFVGSFLSFFSIPSERARLGLVLDIVMLAVVAVFDIIGGAILANLNATVASAQVFIVLAIFAVAIVFGSKSLLYVSLVLSTILFTILLPPALGGNDKSKAAYSISWIGMVITFIWCIYVIQIVRGENDQFEEDSDSTKKKEEPAA